MLAKRELGLAWAVLLMVLVFVTYRYGEPKYKEWVEASSDMAELEGQKAKRERLIALKPKIQMQMDDQLALLPVHRINQDVTSQILKDLQRTADRHKLTLLRREPGDEENLGNLYEVTVNCTWEGNLEGLTHFLYDLQEQGATFDVRELSVEPVRGSPERLKGRFKLQCAYRRGEQLTQDEPQSGLESLKIESQNTP